MRPRYFASWKVLEIGNGRNVRGGGGQNQGSGASQLRCGSRIVGVRLGAKSSHIGVKSVRRVGRKSRVDVRRIRRVSSDAEMDKIEVVGGGGGCGGGGGRKVIQLRTLGRES